MLSFHFKINKSFKTKSTHPITVPKREVSYLELSRNNLDKGEITMIWPQGERTKARMCFGIAGFGLYYQIRTPSKEFHPEYLSEGEKVFVLLVNDYGKRYAVVEYST